MNNYLIVIKMNTFRIRDIVILGFMILPCSSAPAAFSQGLTNGYLTMDTMARVAERGQIKT